MLPVIAGIGLALSAASDNEEGESSGIAVGRHWDYDVYERHITASWIEDGAVRSFNLMRIPGSPPRKKLTNGQSLELALMFRRAHDNHPMNLLPKPHVSEALWEQGVAGYEDPHPRPQPLPRTGLYQFVITSTDYHYHSERRTSVDYGELRWVDEEHMLVAALGNKVPSSSLARFGEQYSALSKDQEVRQTMRLLRNQMVKEGYEVDANFIEEEGIPF